MGRLAGLPQHLDGQQGQFGIDGVLDGGAVLVVVQGGRRRADAAQVVDDSHEGGFLGLHLGAGARQLPSAVRDVVGMDAQMEGGAAVGVLIRSGVAVAPEEELDDRRIVPGRGGVVEGGAVVGVDLPHGRRAELVDGPEDVEGGVVATGRVQDARGEEVVVGPTIGGNLGGRGAVGIHLGQVQEAPELVPRAPLDEAEAGFLARAGLGGGEVERFGHGRFDGGDAAGDG